MSQSRVPDFTAEQVAWLESQFPEDLTSHVQQGVLVSPNELYLRMGRRQVVRRISDVHKSKRKHLE